MLTKRRLLYLLGMLAFIAYLLFANQLVIMNDPTSLKKDDLSKYETTKPVIFGIVPTILGDLKNSFTITGYATCRAQENNDNRYSKAFLVHESTGQAYRFDLVSRVIEEGMLGFNAKTTLPHQQEDYLSVAETVSTVNLPNGYYELYLYVWENEKEYGLTSTGRFFEKEKGIFRVVLNKPVELLKDVSSVDATRNKSYNYPEISKNGEQLRIVGWTLCEGITTQQQCVYVEITNTDGSKGIYDTDRIQRFDVTQTFQNNWEYLYSGYELNIPFSEDYLKFRLLLENDDTLTTDDRFTYIQAPDVVTPERINNFENTETQRDILMGLERAAVSNDNLEVQFSGWALIKDMPTENQQIFVELKNAYHEQYTYTTQPKYRADVEAAFSREDYYNSGYSLQLDLGALNEMAPTEYRLILVNEGITASTNWVVFPKG